MTVHPPSGDAGWVALSTVTARRELGLRLVVPVQGPPAWVRWAGVVELADPAPYLRGGEFVLTSGLNLDLAAESVDAYVSSLVGAGVSALGFGVAVHDAVPETLVRECRRQALPLVAVPRGTPFVAVCQAVQDLLLGRRDVELRWLEATHHSLAAAARDHDPLAAMVTVLAHSLGCWIVLLDGAGEVAESAGPVPTPLPRPLGDLAGAARRSPEPEWVHADVDGARVLVRRVGAGMVICAGVVGGLDAAGRAVLSAAVVPVQSVVEPVGGASQTQMASAVARLVLAGPDRVDLVRREAVGTLVPSGFAQWRVVSGVAVRQDWSATVAGVRDLVASAVLEVEQGRLRAVVADRGGVGPRLLEELRALGWLAVVSRPVGVDHVHQAAAEADRLLERARAVGAPLTWQDSDTSWQAMVDHSQARQLSRALLAPIAGADEESRELRQALRVWLAHHGDWDGAAATLGGNRRTVRERIRRVQEMLRVDLSDPEQRMRLWFALRWVT